MKQLETLKLKTTAKGSRVWLNNASSKKSGFTAGTNYTVGYYNGYVILQISKDGNRSVAKGDIIDLQNHSMSNSLPDSDRVHVTYLKDKIIVKAHYHESKVKNRVRALLNRTARKLPIRIAEFFAGIGLLGRQIKRGLALAGLSSSLVFANEFDRHASDIHVHSNKEIWEQASTNAIMVNEDLHVLDPDLIPRADIIIAGYPCKGFSKQMSNKRLMDIDHPETGTLFIPFLSAIAKANPAIVIIENSDAYIESKTDQLIDDVMERTGYKPTHTFLKGAEFGDFEPRKRTAKMYYSVGLEEFDLTQLVSSITNTRTVADVLEPMDLNDSNWRDLSYLRKKNSEDSHGHSFIEVKPSDVKLPTFGANYAKMR